MTRNTLGAAGRLGCIYLLFGCMLLAMAASASAQGIRYLEGHADPVYAVTYSPDGSMIVSGSFDKTAIIWDRKTGKPIRTIADHQNLVLAVAVSRDGLKLATGSLDKTAKIYDMPLQSPVAELTGQPGEG
ncbi:MAG: hypothetical protein N2C14_29705, partial [Planctomycetales bacterium]